MTARNVINTIVVPLDQQIPVSTATLGIEVGTFDARLYPHGSRFLACFAVGSMTEGTLTPSVVDCDTSGGTYTAMARTSGTLTTFTTSTDDTTQVQGFIPDPARPFVKLKLVETVSVTTAVPIHLYVLAAPTAF